MKKTDSWKQKLNQFSVILFPILITQLALFSMTFFDIVMSGHAGPEDLAGVAIGSSLWAPISTGLCGILLALTPIVAQLLGAEKKNEVPFQVIQGIYLSIAISVVVIVAGAMFLDPILSAMQLEDTVRTIAREYLIGLSFGIIPIFVYTVLRCFIDALGQTRVTMMITLMSLPINIFFNYVLIFGKLGFPRLGGVGAGYASSITYWVILVIAFVYINRVSPFNTFGVFKNWVGISFRTWKEQLTIGIPIGFAIFFEVSIFAAVTLLMSEFNTATIAAHQAAINFASFVYMVPMSISMALTIAVGYEVGGGRYKDANQYCFLGVGLSVLMAVGCAIGLYVFNNEVARLYTTDALVLELTKKFLIYAIYFQLSDAIAAPIQGALRGYKDVNVTLLMAFISYWILGLPIGYLLVRVTDLGAYGYWVGLISGLAFGAIFLSWRLLRIQKQKKAMLEDIPLAH
ncbi:MATE family efflux transporter [Ammoniphilus sp. CFH 90114]|uniref:MATE family efflux transporter n=1 Tax=Ammoniphilus sp. CFH 90114 TaxID=2493665 RepID=UPI001010043C|nr:MATE family efflux transporter [Ammoniphilus sp. CFH 90114]RXT15350.1 MATE family efflux transporter [Ammoniphilus sp. CFH 90114]